MTTLAHATGQQTQPPARGEVAGTLAGTRSLVRLILRRDRVLLPIWIVLFGLLPVLYTSATASLFPTAADRQSYYESILINPAERALLGAVFNATEGALGAWRAGFLPVLVGLISMLTVIRHTRADEEAGRRELLGATVVGRHAPLAAALVVVSAANLVIGLIVVVGQLRLGQPADGSLVLAASVAAAGWVFAAIAGVAAQLTQSVGPARGICIAVLGLAYLLRAAGDALGETGSWPTWLSPLGWIEQARPYAGDRWWVFLPTLALVAGAGALAFRLSSRRDVGAGVLPARLGPATASASLRTPYALAWRLHRGLLLGWVSGFAIVGLVLGATAKSIADQMQSSPKVAEIFARLGNGSVTDVYLATVLGLLGLVAGGYGIQATLRLRSEEETGRAEPVLATSVSRMSWAASHLVFTLLGPAAALIVGGLGTGLTYGLSTGHLGHDLPPAIGGALVQLPAVWLLASVALLLFGLLPRYAAVSWAALVWCLLLGQLGPLLKLSQWTLDLSPYTHVPKIPGGTANLVPLLWMLVITAVLAAVGLTRLRRRDIGLAGP